MIRLKDLLNKKESAEPEQLNEFDNATKAGYQKQWDNVISRLKQIDDLVRQGEDWTSGASVLQNISNQLASNVKGQKSANAFQRRKQSGKAPKLRR